MPSTPEGLEARSFKIEADEYVLLSFPVRALRVSGGARLSPSERDIVARVLRGQSNRAIASDRRTSPRTVANQLAAIYSKLGVRSRRELAAIDERAGKAT
ncbi:MAG TPA: helix-turn-helix transcriptional regulator [Polyangiaceae bacterium]|nr:helix-turn-helix transcriptional regulator [Polyangiaceae bacterium]